MTPLDGMSLEEFGLVAELGFVEELESIVEPLVPDVEPLELDGTPLVVAPVEPVVSVDPAVEPEVLPDVVPEAAPLVVLSDVVPVVPGAEFAVLPAVPVLPLSTGVVPVDGLPVLLLSDVPVPWAIARPAAMAIAAAAATAPVLNLFMR